jgi:hypothetical protein
VTKRGGDRRSKDYGLSLGMAKELAMVERNEQGRAVRRYFIQCEEALQRSVPEIAAQYRRQLKARIGAASLFKPMCVALESARAEQGKQTQARHYSNESNMIARIVLGGMTAKQWAQANSITGEPRDSMNAGQLEHLTYLESTNITLIDMGMGYDQRKAELIRLSQRWLAKHLGANHANAAVQNKVFPLAGLMYALRGIAYAHEGKAGITVPANASSSFSRRGDEESFETSTRVRGEFLESIKKGLPTIANPVYGYSAPAKSGAGIGLRK